MASIWRDKRSDNWLIKFVFAGQSYTRSCLTTNRENAKGTKATVEETIRLLNTGRVSVPDGADPGTWILSGGRLEKKPGANGALRKLGDICDAYFDAQFDKAGTTLEGETTHINHLKRLLGKGKDFRSLTLHKMEDYVKKRLEEDNRFGGTVSGKTIKKELLTFTQIWDWARVRKYVEGPCPIKDPFKPRKWAIKLPKPEDPERFMTWDEIERRIARGLPDREQKELWKYLFLDEKQIAELLKFVDEADTHPFLYPMFALVAYTGMRRSEMCRSLIDDYQFGEKLIIIRERKRRKDRAATTRDVPFSQELEGIMKPWFDRHPGGRFAIMPPVTMPRRGARSVTQMLTREEAHHHFKTTLAGSKWEVIRGFHALRHSFGAICTRVGIPMNVIAKWMGHTTDEMMKLYQHLFPQDEQKWMQKFPA